MLFDPKALRRLRTEHRMLQAELAQALHISREMISLYESGKAKPGIARIASIAALFNVPVDALLDTETAGREITEPICLRTLRRLRGMTIEELAAHASIAKQTILNIENGKQTARRNTAGALAQALHVDAHLLLCMPEPQA